MLRPLTEVQVPAVVGGTIEGPTQPDAPEPPVDCTKATICRPCEPSFVQTMSSEYRELAGIVTVAVPMKEYQEEKVTVRGEASVSKMAA